MNILVMFDGVGLARLGLEKAGHICTGIELDPWKHYLSTWVGSGNCILDDVRNIDIRKYDAIWASPPCQWYSTARTQGEPISEYSVDLLSWCLNLDKNILWVENVLSFKNNSWGYLYNAAQFLKEPIQNRNRIIGGKFKQPKLFRKYKKYYKGLNLCPCITASEYKGCATDNRRASRYYSRKLTMEECAYHQGFSIPRVWYLRPDKFEGTKAKWIKNIYEGIGNGVPVYMAQAFGEVYRDRFKRMELRR